jgi:hypothetical protein
VQQAVRLDVEQGELLAALSEVAHSSADQEEWEQTLPGYLWVSNVAEAICFLFGLHARRAHA